MARPQWTIMLYLSGDNNLSAEMVRAIDDILAVGVPQNVAITIQYDPLATGLPTLRYYLPPGAKPQRKPQRGPIPLGCNVEAVPDGENAADPKVLSSFIQWSLEQAPSRYRMLVLSGHGAGAIGDFLTDDHVPGRQLRSLSIPRLRKALARAREAVVAKELMPKNEALVHILGMDSCLMSTAEVGYEVRHAGRRDADIADKDGDPVYDASAPLVQYLVGSEGFVPNAGWPYGYLFERLEQKINEGQNLTPASLSGYIVDDIVDYYRNYVAASVSVDMSASNLDELDQLAVALRDLTNELRGNGDANKGGRSVTTRGLEDPKIRDMVILAHWRAQSFKFEQNTDLGDFCELLKVDAARDYPRIAEACERVTSAITEVLGKSDDPARIRQGFEGVDFQHATGLSMYFPWRLTVRAPEFSEGGVDFPELDTYRRLRFPKETGWGDFLSKYLSATMRPRKSIGGETVEAILVGGGAGSGPTNNKYVEGTNKYVEGTNKFLQQFGATLPWSMKNPPQQVEVHMAVQATVATD